MAVNNSLQQQNKKPTFAQFMNSDNVKNRVNAILGGKDGQRFISSLLSAVNVTPTLAECEPMSILTAAMLGESLKLSPSPQLGQYYILPFQDKNRGVTVGTFVLGTRGYIQMAIRSGYYKKLNVLSIKEGELISYDPLNEEIDVKLIEDEEQRENARTVGYYAMFEYLNGFRKTVYWSKAKMEAHALKYSKGYAAKKGYTFWEKDFDSMAHKTMLRQLLSKFGILSIEMQQAYAADTTVVNDDGSVEYIDNDGSVVENVVAPLTEQHKEETTV